MGMTIAEKVLASHSGNTSVKPGDLVVCDIDQVFLTDTIFRAAKGYMPADLKKVVHPERISILLDHGIPAPNIEYAERHIRARALAKEFGITRVFDAGKGGISHQVALENGIALPGQILAAKDSHTLSAGAFNCVAMGLGGPELLQIMCTGKTWYRVSPTVKVTFEGELPPGSSGKDVFMYIAGNFGSFEGHNMEFAGNVSALTLDNRATITTQCSEMSIEFATMPADQILIDYLEEIGAPKTTPVAGDPDANYAKELTVDLSAVKPHIALPNFIPNNTIEVSTFEERVPINQAFIGSCAGGKLGDFKAAASVVHGRKIAPGVRLIVTPSSQHVYLDAVKAGYVQTLVEAGAVVTNSTCGACGGDHMGVVGPGEVCITSSTRNFKGRMGSPDATLYLGSAATVAASAIAGFVTDPIPYLEES